MGAIIYGDTVPYTLSEQFWTLFVMMCARLYLAYLYANVANYLCSLQLNLQTHT